MALPMAVWIRLADPAGLCDAHPACEPVLVANDVVYETTAILVPRRTTRSEGRTSCCVVRWCVFAFCGLFLSAAAGQDASPSASEYTIKAAYIYNFLRYIEWPRNAFENANSPYVVGVLGEMPADLQRSLNFYAESKTIGGRAIRFQHFRTVEEMTACHIVYMTDVSDTKVVQEAASRLSQGSTLLVGETNGFLQHGGEISFFQASNKVRIRLDLKEAKRKGLRPSAKLLQVAQLVE
jgi:hypothetical protein